jgi:hypothetical protein
MKAALIVLIAIMVLVFGLMIYNHLAGPSGNNGIEKIEQLRLDTRHAVKESQKDKDGDKDKKKKKKDKDKEDTDDSTASKDKKDIDENGPGDDLDEADGGNK